MFSCECHTLLFTPHFSHHHEQVALELLKAGADANHAASNGRTAMMLAAQNSHEGCLRALLENGAAVNSQDNSGFSALMLSVQNGHEQV